MTGYLTDPLTGPLAGGTVRGIAATDFDGTLYRSDGTVSGRNLETLWMLGDRHILRVIVTGRSFYSLTCAIDENFPVDFYILSSGSGVYATKQRKLLYATSMSREKAQDIGKLLISLKCDFMVHQVLPDNHLFSYRRSGKRNKDFEDRISYYAEHGREIHDLLTLNNDISQFLVIEKQGSSLFEFLREKLKGCTVIRTTSPLDHESSWIEIFPEGTDKGSTLQWLAEQYNLTAADVFSIGNDYNDLHMLRWARFSFVVANAASPLLDEFRVVPSNDNDGFSEAASLWLKETGL